MRRRILALLVIVALSLALTACGDDDPEGTGSSPSAGDAKAPEKSEAEAGGKAAPDGGKAAPEKDRERPAPSDLTEEEQEAGQTANRFYEVLATDQMPGDPDRTTIDSTSFCALMSEEAKAQTVHYAKVSSGIAQEWDCESAVEFLVIRSKRSGGFEGIKRAEVIGVNAQGDEATATIRFGDGPVTSVPLVREDGEWKLAGVSLGR